MACSAALSPCSEARQCSMILALAWASPSIVSLLTSGGWAPQCTPGTAVGSPSLKLSQPQQQKADHGVAPGDHVPADRGADGNAMSDKGQKVAIIPGGSQGIGAGLVAGYRGRGWAVVANARTIKPGQDPDVLTVSGDIAEPATADRIIEG